MRLIVLPCDGIGPEIVGASVDVLRSANDAFDLGLSFDYDDVGFASLEKHGTTLREEVLERAKTYDGVILGTQSHADYPAPEKGGATCPPASASASTCVPTCARRAPGPFSRRTCATASPWTWSSCAKRPRASIPTATWLAAGAR